MTSGDKIFYIIIHAKIIRILMKHTYYNEINSVYNLVFI